MLACFDTYGSGSRMDHAAHQKITDPISGRPITERRCSVFLTVNARCRIRWNTTRQRFHRASRQGDGHPGGFAVCAAWRQRGEHSGLLFGYLPNAAQRKRARNFTALPAARSLVAAALLAARRICTASCRQVASEQPVLHGGSDARMWHGRARCIFLERFQQLLPLGDRFRRGDGTRDDP